MRVLSSVELDHIAGGDGPMNTVVVTGQYQGGDYSGVGGVIDFSGGDYSGMEANAGSGSSTTLPQVALEVLACKKALDAMKKTPTWTNNAAAAAACTKALQDAIDGLGDWGKEHPDFVKAMTVKPVP